MLGFQPPAIGDEEIEAVAETLRSGWLTTGPRTKTEASEGEGRPCGVCDCHDGARVSRR